mgnify:CR=1 FL=1
MKRPLSIVLLFASIWALAQRNLDNEILIFFNAGVEQQTESVGSSSVHRVVIRSAQLKNLLTRFSIPIDRVRPAMPDFELADTLRILTNGKSIRQPNMKKLYRLIVPEGTSKQQLIDELRSLPEVLFAESNGNTKPLIEPSDADYGNQWALSNFIYPGRDIHAQAAWDIYKGNPANIIAIIDGGIDIAHEDFVGKIDRGTNGFGWEGHGIHVGGIAGATTDNNTGVAGVDWYAKLHNRRIDNNGDEGVYNDIVNSVNYSPNVKVINHSWSMIFEDQSPGRNSVTVRMAFAYAYKSNRVSIAAMGNENQTYPNVTNYPAGFSNVIAVGNSTITDQIAGSSSRGIHIDVAAPGSGILSTYVNGGYGSLSGTSMAAPHVAGVASLLMGYAPYLDNDDVENLIKLSADDLSNLGAQDGTAPGWDVASGWGRLNAENALQKLQLPNELKQWTALGGTVHSTTGTFTQTFFGAGNLADANYLVKRKEVRKTITFPEGFCEVIGAWGRGVDTNGWSAEAPNFGVGFTEIVPGTLTSTGATLRTYVYQVWSMGGQSLGHYPASPANVVFAYSVLGIPEPSAITTGPTQLCYLGQGTYSVGSQSAGTGVTWTKSSNLTIVSGQGTPSLVVTPVSASSGTAWVKATMTGDCGSTTLNQFNLWVNSPEQVPAISYNLMLENPEVICMTSTNDYGDFFAGNIPATATHAEWETDAGQIVSDPTPEGYNSVSIQLNNFGLNRYVRTRNVNECGVSPWTTYTFTLQYNSNGCGEGGFGFAMMYPNPAEGELYIEDLEAGSEELSSESDSFTVSFFNASSEPYYKETCSGKMSINVSSWPEGTYFVDIKKGNRSEVKRLLVK